VRLKASGTFATCWHTTPAAAFQPLPTWAYVAPTTVFLSPRVVGAIRVPFPPHQAENELHSSVAATDHIDMSKARTGTMTRRGDDRWRLQVAGEPDPLTGKRRRLSRTVSGTRAEAREALQRLVVETGAGLQGGATSTVGTLLSEFMVTATLAPTTRQDWQSVIAHDLLPSLGGHGGVELVAVAGRELPQRHLPATAV
jgi:hypothetical protein